MNKLLQYMIDAGGVSDKLLPTLYGKASIDNTYVKKPFFPLTKKELDNNRRLSAENTLKEKRKNVYKTIKPSDYSNVENYVRYAFNNQRDEYDDARSEEGFKIYLGLENNPQYFKKSKYKPTINADPNGEYYSVDKQLEEDIFNSFKDAVKNKKTYQVNEYDVDSDFSDEPNAFWEGNKQMVKLSPNDDNLITGRPMVSRARVLGNFGVSRGSDKKGDYLSYYDQYDFPNILQNQMQGNPYKIYGRIYYNDQKKNGGPIVDARGQWAHPGEITRIPSNQITMQGVPYPVLGIGNNGQQQMMYPNQEYYFSDADYVDEYPMMQNGGGILNNNITCSNCGWSWKAFEGGADPFNCHKCGGVAEMNQGGEMIRRADGSYSRRGLWDNIRDNRGSGKKPTAEMLRQEREISQNQYGGGISVPTLNNKIIVPKQTGGETLANKIINARDEVVKTADGYAKKYYKSQENNSNSVLNVPSSLNYTGIEKAPKYNLDKMSGMLQDGFTNKNQKVEDIIYGTESFRDGKFNFNQRDLESIDRYPILNRPSKKSNKNTNKFNNWSALFSNTGSIKN